VKRSGIRYIIILLLLIINYLIIIIRRRVSTTAFDSVNYIIFLQGSFGVVVLLAGPRLHHYLDDDGIWLKLGQLDESIEKKVCLHVKMMLGV